MITVYVAGQAGPVTPAAPAAPEPAPTAPGAVGRDRYLDALRALALLQVAFYHMYEWAWIAYAVPAMGVMFALGGSLMWRSAQRSHRKAITNRIRRLLPALWVAGIFWNGLMLWRLHTGASSYHPQLPNSLLWILPIAPPPAASWAWPIADVLWYLVTYLWLVLLTPVTAWLYRRLRLGAALVPLALLVVLYNRQLPLSDTVAGVLTDVLTFAACWIVGYAHRDGTLRRLDWSAAIMLGALCLAIGAYWAHAYPPSPGDHDLNDIPVAQAFWSLGAVFLLMRLAPGMAWLRRQRFLDRLVAIVNARAVTIYLWQNTMMVACFPVGDKLGLWHIGPRLGLLAYLAVELIFLVVPVLVLGWAEDLGARRRPQLIPGRPAAPPAPPEPVLAQEPAPGPEPPATHGGRHARAPRQAVSEPTGPVLSRATDQP